MIRFFIVIFSALFSVLSSFGQQLEISPKIFDFGTIKEEDGVVKATFTVKNISSSPYIMTYFYSSCGCVTTEIDRKPIMPNETREIEVDFDPMRRPGIINKEVVLISADNNRKDKLNLGGHVIPRKKSLQELYPLEVMDGVCLSEDYFPFGIINQGDYHTGIINIYNSSDESISLSVRRVGDNAYGSIELTEEKLSPNTQGQLHFGYDLTSDGAYGAFTDTVYLAVNGVEIKQLIKSNAIGIYNIFGVSDSQRENTSKPIVSPLRYFVSKNEEVVIPISNGGVEDLEIVGVVVDSEKISYSLTDTKVKKGEKIYLKSRLIDGERGEVVLLLNSIDSPVMTINLVLK